MSKKTGAAKDGNTGKSGGNVPRADVVQPEQLISKDPLAEPVVLEKLPITLARWEEAQKAEREQHTMGAIEGAIHYGKSYKNYFKLLGLGNNLHGLNVIEVGPADFPALAHCTNWGHAVIVEPMPSAILEAKCKEQSIGLFKEAFEHLLNKYDNYQQKINGVTEVWLLNVMQHVIDPEVFIETAKQLGDRIRFFEPIDQPITTYHPHTYGLKDYHRWFGDCVNLYAGGSIEGFHEAACAYGVWIKG